MSDPNETPEADPGESEYGECDQPFDEACEEAGLPDDIEEG
jgi:hypothetical protein